MLYITWGFDGGDDSWFRYINADIEAAQEFFGHEDTFTWSSFSFDNDDIGLHFVTPYGVYLIEDVLYGWLAIGISVDSF